LNVGRSRNDVDSRVKIKWWKNSSSRTERKGGCVEMGPGREQKAEGGGRGGGMSSRRKPTGEKDSPR